MTCNGTSNQTRIGNTVLVKLPNGQTKPMTRIPKRPFELLRVPKNSSQQPMSAPRSRSLVTAKKIPSGPDLTPSVSIAPVAKKMMPPMMHRHSDSDSESDERKIMSPPLAHKPKAKPPVQTIDISSDDDCIVVSEPEEEEEETDHDDPTNSGLHTNDQFNQPDEQGRVLVNVGHPEGEPDVFVAPQISRIIKPHQIGGV
uniref:Helicase ARIP4-like n=1 Tax=Diabrotica virgifera virgifera TaxID=50390 RepID=A0A6P7F9S4_DIAVI